MHIFQLKMAKNQMKKAGNKQEKFSNDADARKYLQRYSKIPVESEQLDEFEFQVFVMLREWRAQKAKDDKEWIHHIATDCTFLELVRRKSNDAEWAAGDSKKIRADLAQVTESVKRRLMWDMR